VTPEQVAASYDQIADRWLDIPSYGFAQIERSIAFVKHKGMAIDVGCGTGRLMSLFAKHGFRTDGLDVSTAMIALARQRHPESQFYHADICQWELPKPYDLIVAWDSIWHVPLAAQQAVLMKLCTGLTPGGVLVFTMGGTDAPNETHDSYMGPPMYHATLGVSNTLKILDHSGCVCRHIEYDQHPELHLCVIAQKYKVTCTTRDLVRLRNVERADLPRLFEMQLDPESNRMAVTIPRSAEAFEAHWVKVLQDSTLSAKAILLGQDLVGTVSCFIHENQANVGYWISREHWGKGIASQALELHLLEVPIRPIYAHVATSNSASLRVLQKCGFVIERVQLSPATERFPECEETILILR
jgi:RimJ/RimL family protein N-acetyltransferase